MRLLSVVHGEEVRGEVFDDVVRGDGHELDEWWIVERDEPPRPLADYDAVLLFGGPQNVDEEDEHSWLRREDEFVRELLERRVPTLGVCLGGQLLAKAAGAHVGPSPEPEFGFTRVELSDAAAGDPLFGSLPHEFDVWNAHGYAFHVPEDGVELARSPRLLAGFQARGQRVGRAVPSGDPCRPGDALAARGPRSEREASFWTSCARRYDEWRSFGAELLRSFLRVAARPPARSG